MRNRARMVRRIVAVTAVAAGVLVGTTSVAGASAPPKFQVTVTDDFSSGSIGFVVATVPPVVPAGTYEVGLANNSIGPHVLIALGGLREGITQAKFLTLLDQGPPPPAGVFEAGAVFSKPGQDQPEAVRPDDAGAVRVLLPDQDAGRRPALPARLHRVLRRR